MAQTIVSVFKYQEGVESAINELKDLNYDPKGFSIVMKDVREAQEIEESTGVSAAKGAVSGAITGGVLAGVAGLLVGIGAITIPGLGGLLIAGPVAGALGLTGAAATTTSAALTGAAGGGLIGALAGIGLPKDEATKYEENIRGGGILLIVPTMDRRIDEVRGILSKHGATDIRQLDLHAETGMYEPS